jgi:hypothetical protein
VRVWASLAIVPAPNIPAHLESLVGRDIVTVTGRTNRVLSIQDGRVFVRTGSTRPARGEAVEIAVVQDAAERLWRGGELRIDPATVGYRSAFVGAVLGSLPGTEMLPRPARVVLTRRGHTRRGSGSAGSPSNARWWSSDPAERFWLEVSDRAHFGADLRAPDDARTSHALVRELRPDDVVFHYDKRRHVIIGWSQAVGRTRHVAGEYRTELGGMLGAAQVTLERLQEFDALVREIAAEIEARGLDMRGFPFECSKTRPIRPLPAYLSKLPLRIVEAIPELGRAVGLGRRRRRPVRVAAVGDVGGAYREANEGVTIPVLISPESEAWRAERSAQRAERSTREHNRLQNRLERFLRSHHIPTLSPQQRDIPFDLAWRRDEGLAFAEIKSLPAKHASTRLRLGLGQCLFYRHVLRARSRKKVAAFLVVPREPEDPAWPGVCAAVGVTLIWPERFGEAL